MTPDFRSYKKSLEVEGHATHNPKSTTPSLRDPGFIYRKHSCPGCSFISEEMKIVPLSYVCNVISNTLRANLAPLPLNMGTLFILILQKSFCSRSFQVQRNFLFCCSRWCRQTQLFFIFLSFPASLWTVAYKIKPISDTVLYSKLIFP